MGNKHSSSKDAHFSSESRGRSRSFNGLASRFRKASRSPPRERSSSFGESAGKPHRKGSGKMGQNGVFKGGQGNNGHLIRRGHDIPITTTLTRDNGGVDVQIEVKKVGDVESLGKLSQSAPSGRGFHYRHSPARNVTPIAEQVSVGTMSVKDQRRLSQDSSKLSCPSPSKSIILDENDTIIKSSNLKNLKNKQLSQTDKQELIENYSENTSHISADKMRTVSRELFSDQLEDLAKRRGMATLNRDLSLSNASLGLLSNRSKSMHSLSSNDYDYEERCKVGELLSFEDSHQVGELCRSITSQFSSENQQEKDQDIFLRPRTSSASAVDLGSYNRKQMAFGKTSAEIRRNLASQYAIDPNKSAQKSSSANNVGSDVMQARRMLVARALKDGEKDDNVSVGSVVPPQQSPQIAMAMQESLVKQHSLQSLKVNESVSLSPSSPVTTGLKASPKMGRRSSAGRLTGVITSPEKSYSLAKQGTPSPSGKMFITRRTSSPIFPQGLVSTPEKTGTNQSISRTSSGSFLQNIQSPVSITDKSSTHQSMSRISSGSLLQNIDVNQLLAANMTKSMQKFLLDDRGIGTNSTDYEKLHNKLNKNKIKKSTSALPTDEGFRERSSSFSMLLSRQQQQQFVQQMISQQQAELSKKQEKVQDQEMVVSETQITQIVHLQTKSYDSTPVSTGGDSGFRSRSQSWSSLSRKSVYESQREICGVSNPVSNLWSYSEVSLAELPVDLTSQPQRYISVIEDDGPSPENLNFSHAPLAKGQRGLFHGPVSLVRVCVRLPNLALCVLNLHLKALCVLNLHLKAQCVLNLHLKAQCVLNLHLKALCVLNLHLKALCVLNLHLKALCVLNLHLKAQCVLNLHLKALCVLNLHLKALCVLNLHLKAQCVLNLHLKALCVLNLHLKALCVLKLHLKAQCVLNLHLKTLCVLSLHLKTLCVLYLHLKAQCVLNFHLKAQCVLYLHIKAQCVLNLHLKTFGVLNLHLKALCVLNLHLKALCVLNLHLKALCVLNLHLKTLCVLNLHLKALCVLNLHLKALCVLNLHLKALCVLNLHLKALCVLNLHLKALCVLNLHLKAQIKALANSVDPDEMPHDAASHQGLRCLLKGIS
ncbi:hypothetical protein DPMN_077589, partial [Dreissena polymorpha]